MYRDNGQARVIIDSLIQDASTRPGDAASVLHTLRMAMIDGGEAEKPIRARAIRFFTALLPVAQNTLESLEQEHAGSPFSDWPLDAQTRAKGAMSLIKGVSDQVYFASGAFDLRRRKYDRKETWPELPTQSIRFYHEASTLIDRLTTVRLVAASHHVVETIAFFSPLDPARSFLRIAESIRSGKTNDYQNESLGSELIVEIVERYLAEFRHVFRENDECRQVLLELLDTFVTAGWPSARKLTYRLDEIFR